MVFYEVLVLLEVKNTNFVFSIFEGRFSTKGKTGRNKMILVFLSLPLDFTQKIVWEKAPAMIFERSGLKVHRLEV